jgi:hypothetical protein
MMHGCTLIGVLAILFSLNVGLDKMQTETKEKGGGSIKEPPVLGTEGALIEPLQTSVDGNLQSILGHAE